MKSVAIIGAGITGLTAAFYLKRRGLAVTVYESSGRVGGVIQSLRQNGFLAEFGPNTLLETSPRIAQLIRDADLQARRLDPEPMAEARYVVRYRRPIAMPGSPLGFLTTDLFTLKAKLAVLRERLDRFDPRPFGFHAEHQATEHRLAVEQYRARAAITVVATFLAAGQVQRVAQHFQQTLPRLAQELRAAAVDLCSDNCLLGHSSVLHFRRSGIRQNSEVCERSLNSGEFSY